jgi:hypothetical protein
MEASPKHETSPAKEAEEIKNTDEEPIIVDESNPIISELNDPLPADNSASLSEAAPAIVVSVAQPDEPVEAAPPKQQSPFAEVKDRAKYLCKNSKFTEAREVVERAIAELVEGQHTIDARSRLYLRLVLVLQKAYNSKELGRAYVRYISLALAEAKAAGDVSSIARLLYAKQRITNSLNWRDQTSVFDEVTKLLEENPESFDVAKYYVKIHVNVPKDGLLVDAKQAYLLF